MTGALEANMFSLPRTPFEKFWDSIKIVFSPEARPVPIETTEQDYALSKEDILRHEGELQNNLNATSYSQAPSLHERINRHNAHIEGRKDQYHRPL